MVMQSLKSCRLAATAVLLLIVAAGCSLGATQTPIPTAKDEAGVQDCQGSSAGAWNCPDIPSYSHTQQVLAQKAATERRELAAKKIADREARTRQTLLDIPSNYYVVQLLAAKYKRSITEYKERFPGVDSESFSVNYDGENFHLLILGVYLSVAEARKAIAQLPTAPDPEPWIRPLSELQTHL